MKKVQTTYVLVSNVKWSALLTENNEIENHYSIHDYGEPCSGRTEALGHPREPHRFFREDYQRA